MSKAAPIIHPELAAQPAAREGNINDKDRQACSEKDQSADASGAKPDSEAAKPNPPEAKASLAEAKPSQPATPRTFKSVQAIDRIQDEPDETWAPINPNDINGSLE